MRKGFALVVQSLAAFVLSAVAFFIGVGVLWPVSVQTPVASGIVGVIFGAVAFLLWRNRPSVPGRIFAAFAGLFTIVAVIGFASHIDGKAAAALQAEKAQREAEVRAAALERERLAAEAAQRQEQERRAQAEREKTEMDALRKTNVDQYLERLKLKDVARWLEEAKTLRPRVYAAHVAEEKRQEEESKKRIEMQAQRVRPLDYLTLDMSWNKGGFGSVMIATFTIKSTLGFAVQDMKVRCTISGASGTELQDIRQTIFQVMPAKATKRFEVNMGFVHSQGERAYCKLTDVQLST